MKGKRARSTNFTPQEEDLLLSLVEKNSKVVECKKTNATTWLQKQDAWMKIQNEFVSQCQTFRTVKNLTNKYDNIKRTAKDTMAKAKKNMYVTGGGEFCSQVTAAAERVAALMGSSASGLDNSVDSDRTLFNTKEQVAISKTLKDLSTGQFDDLEIIEEKEEEVRLCSNKEPEKEIKKGNTWSSWNPSQLQKKKSPKKRILETTSDEVLKKQKLFFENENKSLQERKSLQRKELELYICYRFHS